MIYWLDSQLNTRTRPQENFGREIMELFSLGIGNYTEQDVYAAARVFTGFNWQIVGDRASTPTSYYTFLYRPERSRHQREGVHVRDLSGRRPHHSRARGRAPASRTRCDLIIALARHPATAQPAGDAALQVLRQRDVGARSGADHRDGATRTWRTTTTSSRCCARCSRRRSSATRRTSSSAIRGRSSSSVRAIKETGWTGFSVNTAITPLDQHGPAAVRAARRQRLGARAGLDLDLVDAGAHELRVDACRQPAVQPGARRAAVPRSRRSACSSTCWRASGRWASRRRQTTAMIEYLRSDGVDRHRRAAAAAHSRADAPDRRIRRVPVQLTDRRIKRTGPP